MHNVDDPLTGQIIRAAIEVHRHLGPGLLESTYEYCLSHELTLMGLKSHRQYPLPIIYKGVKLELGCRIDLIVEDAVVVEVKAVSALTAIHDSQLLTYLRMRGGGRGLLINFNVKVLKEGIRRMSV